MSTPFLARLAALFALCLVTLGNSANASSTCSTSFYSNYTSCRALGGSFCFPYSSPEEYVAAHPQCFPGGSSTSQAALSTSLFQQIGSISSALSTRLLGNAGPVAVGSAPQRGMAAGGKNAWNGWVSVADNETRQAFRIGPNLVNHELSVTNIVLGADYALAADLVAGVSGAFDRGDGKTRPTAFSAIEASITEGYSIAPYVGYQLNKELALDASIGFGSGKNTSAGGLESSGNRQFHAANLSYSRWLDTLQLTGKLGYLHGEEKLGDTKLNGAAQVNTAAKNKLDRWQLGAQLAYWVGNGVQPYVGIGYLADRRSSSQAGTDPIGKAAWLWALGLNYFSVPNGINAGIAYNQESGRSNQKNNSLTANFGMRF